MRDAPGLERGLHHLSSFPLMNLTRRFRAEGWGVVDRETVAPLSAVYVEERVEEGKTMIFWLGSQILQEFWRTVQGDDSTSFSPFRSQGTAVDKLEAPFHVGIAAFEADANVFDLYWLKTCMEVHADPVCLDYVTGWPCFVLRGCIRSCSDQVPE